MGLNQRTGNSWHFSRIEKLVISITITAILIVSAFGFVMNPAKPAPPDIVTGNDPTASPSATPDETITPTAAPTSNPTTKPPEIKPPGGGVPIIPPDTQKQPGIIETSPNMNSTAWKAVAANAWAYFQPGVAIDSSMGLPAAGLGWNQFTDWDLGVYIQAIMDAQKIGLINKDGEWGASARLEKVIRFLETRELNSTTKVPYWFYKSDGTGYSTQERIDVIDTGTLFVALHNVKLYEPSLASRINNIVYNSNHDRTDYTALIPGIAGMATSSSIYAYYCANGFAYFWPELADVPDQILDNMYTETVTSYNVTLPKADLLCEPLLNAFFNLNPNPRLTTLMNDTYFAHEAKYNATKQFVAFSEGNTASGFVWEWVVRSNGDTWTITDGATTVDINPIVYSKASMGFLAIYNTTFARDMCIYLERVFPEPTSGYYDGADFKNNINLVSVLDSRSCNTNSLILAAARYALSA